MDHAAQTSLKLLLASVSNRARREVVEQAVVTGLQSNKLPE